MTRLFFLGALTAMVLAGCGSGGPELGRLEPSTLYERGLEEYHAGEWDEAARYFRRLVLQYPMHPRVQRAHYLLASAYFSDDEYVTAADEFAQLADDHPEGEFADDARFKVCESYQRLSPIVQRDQEYTRAAVDHCRALISYHPSSEFVPEARAIIRAMKDKLAKKIYVTGEFYFTRGAYDSAIIYYEDVAAQYPESEAAPKALLRIVEAYREIGYTEEAERARQRLLREYPESAAAQDLEASSVASRR